MKYKVGDKARVRRDLEIGKSYGEGKWAFNSAMSLFAGDEITIKAVNDEFDEDNFYDIEEDFGMWGWVDEMFEGYAKEYKLIDVLNKIANGEIEEGTKVIYNDMEFVYDGEELWSEEDLTIHYYIDYNAELNKVVELIEPEHIPEVGKMVEKLDMDALTWNDLKTKQKIEILFNKINELIDAMEEE